MLDLPTSDPSPAAIATPRVTGLFRAALAQPLLTVASSAGYGAGDALALAIEQEGLPSAWLRLRRLDNLPVHFWQSLLVALQRDLPALHPHICTLSFPETLAETDHFLHIVSQALDASRPTVLVLEAMEHLACEAVLQFLLDLLEAEIPALRLVLLSSRPLDVRFQPGTAAIPKYHISQSELAYTQAEIEPLLAPLASLSPENLAAEMLKTTGGWPLAVHALLRHWQANGRVNPGDLPAALPEVEQAILQAHHPIQDEALRLLMVKLSLPDAFSMDIAARIGHDNLPAAMAAIQESLLITKAPLSGLYSFHPVLAQHLRGWQPAIAKAERQRVLRVSGAWFLKHDHPALAVKCFADSGDYGALASALARYARTVQDGDAAASLLTHLDSIPEVYLSAHPDALLFKANVYMRVGDPAASRQCLQALLAHPKASPVLRGEAHFTLAEIALKTDLDEASEHFDKAAALLPEGTANRGATRLYILNRSLFRLHSNAPGHLEQMELGIPQIAKKTELLYGKAAHEKGHSSGWAHLFLAESAFYTGRFDRAHELANRAAHDAFRHGQYDIQCNAWFLLARLHVFQGKYREGRAFADKLVAFINTRKIVQLYILRDCVEAWFHLKMRDFQHMPLWMMSSNPAEPFGGPLMSGREQLLHAHYRCAAEDYALALPLFRDTEAYSRRHGLWIITLKALIMQAFCHAKLGDPGALAATFSAAYDMAYANDIIIPFVEEGALIRTVLRHLRKVKPLPLDTQWLDAIDAKASTYDKRMSAVLREYRLHKNDPPNGRKSLTTREREVLTHLTQGLTYQEIGEAMRISVNGVKKHISSIYGKLGALNRSDAMYIAVTEGIVAQP